MKRIQIGKVSVDSGQILIIDPAYTCHCTAVQDIKAVMNSCEPKMWTKLTVAGGRAVISRTRFGDGLYPVVAFIDDDNRLERLVIEFLEESGEAAKAKLMAQLAK